MCVMPYLRGIGVLWGERDVEGETIGNGWRAEADFAFLDGILGFISGVAVSTFSKTLAVLFGLVVCGIQVRSSSLLNGILVIANALGSKVCGFQRV